MEAPETQSLSSPDSEREVLEPQENSMGQASEKCVPWSHTEVK